MLTLCPFSPCDRVGILLVRITGRRSDWPAEVPSLEFFLEAGFCAVHAGEVVTTILSRQPWEASGPLASLMRDPESTIVARIFRSPDLN